MELKLVDSKIKALLSNDVWSLFSTQQFSMYTGSLNSQSIGFSPEAYTYVCIHIDLQCRNIFIALTFLCIYKQEGSKAEVCYS